MAVGEIADDAQMEIRPCRGGSVWVPHSASPWAGDAAEKLIMTASCGRRPVVDGQAGEQYASLTRLGLPVAVKALAGVWLRGAARYETRDTGACPRSRLSGVARGLAQCHLVSGGMGLGVWFDDLARMFFGGGGAVCASVWK